MAGKIKCRTGFIFLRGYIFIKTFKQVNIGYKIQPIEKPSKETVVPLGDGSGIYLVYTR